MYKTIQADKEVVRTFIELSKKEGRTQGKMLEILLKEYNENHKELEVIQQ
jgi:hypothetical protein